MFSIQAKTSTITYAIATINYLKCKLKVGNGHQLLSAISSLSKVRFLSLTSSISRIRRWNKLSYHKIKPLLFESFFHKLLDWYVEVIQYFIFSLIKMLYGFAKNSHHKPTQKQLIHSVLRNFGGLDGINPVEIFLKPIGHWLFFTTEEILCHIVDSYKNILHERKQMIKVQIRTEGLIWCKTQPPYIMLCQYKTYFWIWLFKVSLTLSLTISNACK